MKKIIIATLVAIMFFVCIGISGVKAESRIYGNIYLFDTNIPFLWSVLHWQPTGFWMTLNTNTVITKAVGLTNWGKIINIVIAIPLEKSFVIIQNGIQIVILPLTFHAMTTNCIIFNFTN